MSQLVGRQFVNNRATNTAYDSDGRSLANRIDAAGRGIENLSRERVGGYPETGPTRPAFEITQKFDGNGGIGKRKEIKRRDEEVNGVPTVVEEETDVYYLRSTVLGGKPVADIDAATGAKKKGYIYAGGQLIAEQISCLGCNPPFYIVWKETNPLTGGRAESQDGSGTNREEVDPMGAALGNDDPWLYQVEPFYHGLLGNQEPLFLEMGNPFDPNSPYEIDGLPVSEAEFNHRMENGSAEGAIFRGGRFESTFNLLSIGLFGFHGHLRTEFHVPSTPEVPVEGGYAVWEEEMYFPNADPSAFRRTTVSRRAPSGISPVVNRSNVAPALPCAVETINFFGAGSDGIGGIGNGMVQTGGSFRLTNGAYNGSLFSPQHYPSAWGGGSVAQISTYGMRGVGGAISTGSNVASVVMAGYDTYGAYATEGRFGPNTTVAAGSGAGSVIGSFGGAKGGAIAGAAIGVWFGGAGALPGSIIGGIIGGVGGGMAGSHFGGEVVRRIQDRNLPSGVRRCP